MKSDSSLWLCGGRPPAGGRAHVGNGSEMGWGLDMQEIKRERFSRTQEWERELMRFYGEEQLMPVGR